MRRAVIAAVLLSVPAAAPAQHILNLLVDKMGGRTKDRGDTGAGSRGQPGSIAVTSWPGGRYFITATGGRNDDREEIADRVMRRAAALARTSGKPLIHLSSDRPAIAMVEQFRTYAGTPDTQAPVTALNQDGSVKTVGQYTVPGSGPTTVRKRSLPEASIVAMPMTEAEATAYAARLGKPREDLLIFDAAQFAEEIDRTAGRPDR